MGNSHSRQIYSHFNEPLELSKFTLIEQFFVEPLGEIHELSTNNSNDKLFLKIINIDREIQSKEINSIHSKLDLKHPTLLKLYGYNFAHKSSAGHIQTEAMFYFEPPAKTFQDEIMLRKSNHESFPATELLHYFKNCIEGLAYLEENGCSYEYLTAETIFFSYNHEIQIINPAVVDLINLSETLKKKKEKEKEKRNIKTLSKVIRMTEKSIRNSVITLGVTFLASALLEEEEILYQLYETYDYERFQILNERLRSRYPLDFINILRHMLNQDEYQRPRFTQLRDHLDRYTKSNGQDDQFPISPIFLDSPDRGHNENGIPDTAPSKLFKSVYSSSFVMNSFVSPRNPLTSSKLAQETVPKEPEKSLLDKLFCGLCTSAADEKTEVIYSARPYRRTENNKQIRIEESQENQTLLQDHLLEEFSKDGTDRQRERILNTGRKKVFGDTLQVNSNQNRSVNIQNSVQTEDHSVTEFDNKRNIHMSSKPSVSMRYMESNEAIKEDQYESSQNISHSHKEHSPLQVIRTNENQQFRSTPVNTSPGTREKRRIFSFKGGENEFEKEKRRIEDMSILASSQKHHSTVKKSVAGSAQKNIQNLNPKKKSALVKKIIAQYKKESENNKPQNDLSQSQSRVFGQHFDKSFRSVASKFESQEKPYRTPSRILITDYLVKTHEKKKNKNQANPRGIDVTDSQNFKSNRSNLMENDKKSLRQIRQIENFGANQNSQSMSQIMKPKSNINSNYSTPFRGSHPSRKSSVFVSNTECPNCHIPFMSINKSYQYSVPGDVVITNEEREILSSYQNPFSQRESPNLYSETKRNSDVRVRFSPETGRYRDNKNDSGYNLIVTRAYQ